MILFPYQLLPPPSLFVLSSVVIFFFSVDFYFEIAFIDFSKLGIIQFVWPEVKFEYLGEF